MRRLALLLTAFMLTFMSTGVAHAQYPPLLTGQLYSCAVGGTPVGSQMFCSVRAGTLSTGTVVEILISYGVKVQVVGLSFDSDAAAVGFSGAQSSGTATVTMTGTVRADGGADLQAALNPPADPDAPFSATLSGTAADGSAFLASETFNAAPAAPDAGGAEETPATGTESGILALISLALVAAGAGAVVMARRKPSVEV